jgi:multiple sugar transport system ATP-binding protein
MGRAIVREPAAFLMDEPLSNLDAKLRVGMRAELARLHERLRVTTVYVTHDQIEAMTLGQRVAVMREGRIQQVDAPQMLYSEPANLFVAAFIGSPAMNLVEARLRAGAVTFAGFELPVDSGRTTADGRKVILGIRPEAFEDAALAPGLPTMDVRVEVVEDLGSDAHVIFTIDAPRVEAEELKAAVEEEQEGLIADDRAVFNARVSPQTRAQPGESLRLAVDCAKLYFFDPETGETLLPSRAEAAATAPRP